MHQFNLWNNNRVHCYDHAAVILMNIIRILTIYFYLYCQWSNEILFLTFYMHINKYNCWLWKCKNLIDSTVKNIFKLFLLSGNATVAAHALNISPHLQYQHFYSHGRETRWILTQNERESQMQYLLPVFKLYLQV